MRHPGRDHGHAVGPWGTHFPAEGDRADNMDLSVISQISYQSFLCSWLVCVVMLIRYWPQAEASLTSQAALDPEGNPLKATISPDGPHDKVIVLEGSATDSFRVQFLVSQQRGGASNTQGEDVHFEVKDGKLSLVFEVKDGKLSLVEEGMLHGPGEHPTFRRESDREIVVYYPSEVKGERTWVKFRVVMKK